MLGAEQRLRAVDRELLDLVDDLAAAVVALARIALGVLVRRHRADRLEHGRPGEVLGRDQLDLAALALELAPEQLGDLRVDVVEARASVSCSNVVCATAIRLLPPRVRGHATAGSGSADRLAHGRERVLRGDRALAEHDRLVAGEVDARSTATPGSSPPSSAAAHAAPDLLRHVLEPARAGPPARFALVATTAPTRSSDVAASPLGQDGHADADRVGPRAGEPAEAARGVRERRACTAPAGAPAAIVPAAAAQLRHAARRASRGRPR